MYLKNNWDIIWALYSIFDAETHTIVLWNLSLCSFFFHFRGWITRREKIYSICKLVLHFISLQIWRWYRGFFYQNIDFQSSPNNCFLRFGETRILTFVIRLRQIWIFYCLAVSWGWMKKFQRKKINIWFIFLFSLFCLRVLHPRKWKKPPEGRISKCNFIIYI